MVEIDRVFLIILAVIMYAHGFPNIVIGSVLGCLLILEYMFYHTNYN